MLLAVLIAAWGCDRGAEPNDVHVDAGSAHGQGAPATETSISQERIEKTLAAAQEYLNAHDAMNAQAILVTLIDRAPREVRARELYGQCLAIQAEQADRKRDPDTALHLRQQAYEQYKAAVQLTPDSAGLQQSAGMMALAARENNAAIEHFQTAAKLDPANTQYPLFTAQILIAANRLQEAQTLLERVVKLDADEPIAHASLAMIALELGQFDDALRKIGSARRLRPDDVDFRAQEAKVHRRNGDAKRSLELLVGLGPADRAREVVAFEIAAGYGALGDHINAVRAWEHCYQTNPLSPRAWFAAAHTGQALLNAGERDQAMLWLQHAQMAGPNQPEVIALRDALSNSEQNSN